jgi:arylsulfatase A-like enzyme
VILRHTVSPNHYPTGWAQAFCAPFKWYKRFNWIGRVRDQYCHDIDLAPTTYEALGFEMPDRVKNIEQIPLEGTSVPTRLTMRTPRPRREHLKEEHAAFGTVTLFINDQQVDQQKIKAQIGIFTLR